MQRPVRVTQVRPANGDEIGASRGDDAVHLVGLGDISHRDRRHMPLVADPVTVGRLVHPAVDGLRIRRRLAGGDMNDVGTRGNEGSTNADRLVRRESVAQPVGCRDADGHRAVRRPLCSHRTEHLDRIAQPVGGRAAVLVAPPIADGCEKAREQIAVRGVQLEHVEAGVDGHSCRAHEVVAHVVHVGPGHGARHGQRRRVRQRGGTNGWPRALTEGKILSFPWKLRGPFAARVSELETDLCRRPFVHEVHHAAPVRSVLRRVHPCAAQRDARLRRHTHHFRHDECRAAEGACTEVDEVEVIRCAVACAVHVHGREHDAILQRHVAQAKRREHRWSRRVVSRRRGTRRCPAREPALDVRDIRRIAQPEILVAHPLAAREQTVRELLRRKTNVPLDVLEPLHRVACGVLEPQRCRHAFVLISGECGGYGGRLAKRLRERNRIFHRQFRSGPNREVRGMRRVTDEDDVLVKPSRVAHACKARPWRRRAMRRVAHEPVRAQPLGEHRLAGGDGFIGVHAVEPGRAP